MVDCFAARARGILSFWSCVSEHVGPQQGCINRSILPSGMGARGVSSEHMENMEMFFGSPLRCSPVLHFRCALEKQHLLMFK